MSQWHGIVYSMNIDVSMTWNCIFYEYMCVNDTEWNYSTMSKNWPSDIWIVCDLLVQPYMMYSRPRRSFAMPKCPQWGNIRWPSVHRGSWLPWTKIDVPVSCVERCSPQKLIKYHIVYEIKYNKVALILYVKNDVIICLPSIKCYICSPYNIILPVIIKTMQDWWRKGTIKTQQ